MSLSYDLLQLSFKNNSTIERLKKSLTLAAQDGLTSTKVNDIEQEEVDIIISYLRNQGFKLWDYNKFTKVLFVSWT
jgi:hypothetical protein